jgi:hypothetical protein
MVEILPRYEARLFIILFAVMRDPENAARYLASLALPDAQRCATASRLL